MSTDLSPPLDQHVSFSQSAFAYKPHHRNMPVGCSSTDVMYKKHVAMLFSETAVKRFGAVQIKLWV